MKKSWSQPRRIEAAFQRHLFDYLRDPDPAFAERIAREMATAVLKRNAQGWRQAAAASTKSRTIHSLLKRELHGPVGVEVERIVAHNATLIRSLPQQLAAKTNVFIAEQQRRGMRSGAIAEELRTRLPGMKASSVRLLARTETSKAETAVTQARAEAIGIRWYEWSTTSDQRVRTSHRKMDGVLCRFDDPPSPEALAGEKSTLGRYAPGGCPNCRCLALPLVSLDEVSWPHRVYANGQITRMSRAQFSKIAG